MTCVMLPSYRSKIWHLQKYSLIYVREYEEVESMIDKSTDYLSNIMDELDAIVTANEKQTAQILEIANTVLRLSGEV